MNAKRRTLLGIATVLLVTGAALGAEADDLAKALADSGIRAGLCVHLGCGSGERTLALARNEKLVIHALDGDARQVEAARQVLHKAQLGGRVSVERWSRPDLPHPDNFVNLIVAEPGLVVPDAELTRVLCPGGLALVRQAGGWRRLTKARAAGMDDWTHVKHGPDGNPVSQDSIAMLEVPDRLRFICDVLEAWTHFIRSANGRLYVYHSGWFRARDAYNGVLLWSKRDYKGWPGRIVTVGDRLYIRFNDAFAAIDGATGQTAFVTEPVADYLSYIVADGALLVRTAEAVRAFDAATGKPRWSVQAPEHPDKLKKGGGRWPKSMAEQVQQLYAGDGRVYFSTGRALEVEPGPADRKGRPGVRTTWKTEVVGVDIKTGKQVWRCADERLGGLFSPLLWADGVLLGVSGPNYVGLATRGVADVWTCRVRTRRGDSLADADFRDPRRAMKACLYADGLFWLHDSLATVYGEQVPDPDDRTVVGYVGLDPKTGRPRRRIGYPVRRDWGGIHPKSGQYVQQLDVPVDRNWSGRCYDDIAAPDCILAQTMEILSLDGKELKHIHGVRGQCAIGFILANNAVYTPPNFCIGCYPMIRGAIAYEVPTAKRLTVVDAQRLQKGPAYGAGGDREPEAAATDAWPMYRHDTLRTSCTPARLDHNGLKLQWDSLVGGRCTQPVVAGGRVVAALIAEGRVVALDAASGKTLWAFDAGSRIDTSPTLDGGLCLFGCHDGYIYCLRASDGALVWRFNAAPEHRRIVTSGKVESPWPVFGAVLVYRGALYATAGHYSAVEGGLHFWSLAPATGQVRFHQVFRGIKGDKAIILPTFWYKHEEHGLNNVLVADRGRIRLYEEWGGWEFSPADGYLLGQIGAVPQPGWPQGRISAGEFDVADRWVWAGWDRVTLAYLLRGEPLTFEQTLEMDPRTRFSGLRTQYMFFPAAGATGIFMRTKGHTTQVEPEPWLVPTDPKIYGRPKGIFKDPKRNEARAKLWPAKQMPLRASAVTITGTETLWIAGALAPTGEAETRPAAAPAPAPAQLHAVSMKTGEDLASWPLPAEPGFEGISVAGGRLYLATVDGRVLCFGR